MYDTSIMSDADYNALRAFVMEPSPAASVAATPKQKTQKRTYQCPYGCIGPDGEPRTFTTKHNLDQHNRTHTGERPHVCSLCQASFSRPWLLYRHLRGPKHNLTIGSQRGRRAKQPVSNAAEERVSSKDTIRPSDTPTSGVGVGVGNQAVSCRDCGTAFYDFQALLAHMHSAHNIPPTPYCACATCSAMFRGPNPEGVETKWKLYGGGFGLIETVQVPIDPQLTQVSGAAQIDARANDESHMMDVDILPAAEEETYSAGLPGMQDLYPNDVFEQMMGFGDGRQSQLAEGPSMGLFSFSSAVEGDAEEVMDQL